jgi:hypothetical protein
MKLNKNFVLAALVLVGLTWMLADSFIQPGPAKLTAGFKEKVFLRNEQNTGPVIRIYVATVKDSLWHEMESYGNFKPHTKYGTTLVYYFLEGTPVPERLNLEGDHIEKHYQQNCIASYKKTSVGQVLFVKRPFASNVN